MPVVITQSVRAKSKESREGSILIEELKTNLGRHTASPLPSTLKPMGKGHNPAGKSPSGLGQQISGNQKNKPNDPGGGSSGTPPARRT
ncbi:transcription initiation factor TFIID subunit 4-like protein [Lates japonicus]|uniref:Transcription initiation factor TFIID subunit 4-like protein n=1 Tax=Lates japonicus TaxID=270547 RepID=A0AAD3R595_LATJO|nr:transcription initiation factor TFIID subunit 4-like protein [Lates japonicus]